ncbi:MAG: hypothetical protein OXG64_08060 [Chloroflexi bacterium]|nr:hypothetical protein [Chloroflexota bacterium]MCY3957133.1 hypothetical protein [Chloroflexota bacterium]
MRFTLAAAHARGRATVLVVRYSGLWASERFGLTLDGLDLDNGNVRARRGKGGNARHVAAGPGMLAATLDF